MSRYIGKYAVVVQSSAEPVVPEVQIAAVMNTSGALSIFLLNSGGTPERVTVEIKSHDMKGKLYLYQVSQKLVSNSNFHLEPTESLLDSIGHRSLSLPEKSISVLTNYYLTSDDPGVIE